MSYFATIVTTRTQDQAESAARDHCNALNAYLDTPGANGKKREVEKMSTAQVVINMNLITTTILCCDEDDDD